MNKEEKKLRKKIIKYYIACAFSTSVLWSGIGAIVDSVMERYANDPSVDIKNINPLFVLLLIAGMITLMFLQFVVGAFIFYRLTKKALARESERRVREQNLIYASLAHDLKTPMTSVRGFAKALSEGRVKPEEQGEICEVIYKKSDSMNEMIDTLFEYAKLGTEGYKPAVTDFDICALLRDTVAECYCELEEHGIETELDIPEEEIVVTGDRGGLKRVFINLIGNVYKHNPDGIRMLVRAEKEELRAVVTIADTGNEIAEEMDIFTPFVTENTARTIGGGTGLGLAVAKRIVELQGGEIEMRRDGGGYSKAFVVRL